MKSRHEFKKQKVRKQEIKILKEKNPFKRKMIVLATILILVGITSAILVPTLYNNHISNKYNWHILEIKAYKAWRKADGEGIVIAVVDTGIDPLLEEHLEDRIINSYNVISETNNVKDSSGHGTEVTCLIACNNYKGIYGIAKKETIMPVVAVDESGRTSPEYIAKGTKYAADNGANIINLSLGSRLENLQVKEAVEYAVSKNVHIVGAAGDYKENKLLYPARYETVISVEAQSKIKYRYKDSNWHEDSTMMLLGEIMHTVTLGENGELEKTYENGTSFATAIGSGVVALYLDNHGSISNKDLVEKLKAEKQENTYFNIYEFIK